MVGAKVLFGIMVCVFILADIAWNVFVKMKYHINYKKIRVYITRESREQLERRLLQDTMISSIRYKIEKREGDGNRYFLILERNGGEVRYLIKLITEEEYTVVLVQYDKRSKGRVLPYDELDTFMDELAGVKLK